MSTGNFVDILDGCAQQILPLAFCPARFPPSQYNVASCGPLECYEKRSCFDSTYPNVQQCLENFWCACRKERSLPSTTPATSALPTTPWYIFPSENTSVNTVPPVLFSTQNTLQKLSTSVVSIARTTTMSTTTSTLFTSTTTFVTTSTDPIATSETPTAGLSDGLIAAIVLLAIAFVALVLIGTFLTVRYMRDRRKNHGAYNPQKEEELAQEKYPEMAVLPPPGSEGLI